MGEAAIVCRVRTDERRVQVRDRLLAQVAQVLQVADGADAALAVQEAVHLDVQARQGRAHGAVAACGSGQTEGCVGLSVLYMIVQAANQPQPSGMEVNNKRGSWNSQEVGAYTMQYVMFSYQLPTASWRCRGGGKCAGPHAHIMMITNTEQSIILESQGFSALTCARHARQPVPCVGRGARQRQHRVLRGAAARGCGGSFSQRPPRAQALTLHGPGGACVVLLRQAAVRARGAVRLFMLQARQQLLRVAQEAGSAAGRGGRLVAALLAPLVRALLVARRCGGALRVPCAPPAARLERLALVPTRASALLAPALRGGMQDKS